MGFLFCFFGPSRPLFSYRSTGVDSKEEPRGPKKRAVDENPSSRLPLHPPTPCFFHFFFTRPETLRNSNPEPFFEAVALGRENPGKSPGSCLNMSVYVSVCRERKKEGLAKEGNTAGARGGGEGTLDGRPQGGSPLVG